MGTMTATGLGKAAQLFIDHLSHGQYKVNGVLREDAELYRKERMGSTVRIYLIIPVDAAGTITEIKLIDKDGDVVCASDEIIHKPEGKGIFKTFKYKFVEEVQDEQVQ